MAGDIELHVLLIIILQAILRRFVKRRSRNTVMRDALMPKNAVEGKYFSCFQYRLYVLLKHLMAALLDSSTVHRSVWCKQRTRGFWEAAKSGILGENWWRDNLRMKKQTFCLLCLELKPFLIKQVTRFRLPIDVDEQVAIMLWRLATNTEYRTIASLFGVGISTVCSIVHKTAQTVVEFLLPKYVCIPLEDKLKEIVAEFESLWGFPQVVGAIDGTHIPILHPQESPSDYYNWKNFYSIIMQAVVDSRCCFVDVNIGLPGKVHDARVLSNSSFFRKANEGSLFPNWKRKIGKGKLMELIYRYLY